MASASRIMDKPRQEQQHIPPPSAAALKCPRCDSSNTKFCYYNNYSLSQPRHFCKACKRYWTRGGTLRNVPVGGGCRKNKRLKTSTSSVHSATSTPSQNPRLHHTTTAAINNIISSSPNSNHINNPMFFGVHNANPSALNLQFSSVESVSGGSGVLNLSPPQLDSVGGGLGFSSHLLLSHIGDLREGFNSAKQIQDISLNSNHFHHPTVSFDRNSQLLGDFGASLMTPTKELKMEGFNRLGQKPMEQFDPSNFSDPSHYWTPATAAATSNWHDPTNNGSSIASLF